jgi:hypothetical protein
MGEPSTSMAPRARRSNGDSMSTRNSGSTSMDQSSSVMLFHCDAIALL